MQSTVKYITKMILRIYCRFLSLFMRVQRPQSPQRILLIAAGYLGDTFWALQTIAILKDQYPHAEIYVAGRKFLQDLAYRVVPADHLLDITIVSDRTREKVDWKGMKREAENLRNFVGPDLVIDLMCNRYSAWFCYLLKTFSVGMDFAGDAAPLYSFCTKQKLIPSLHLAYRPRSIVMQFTGQSEPQELSLIPPIPQKTKEEIFLRYGILETAQLILLIPGAGWQAKQWQPEKFHELAQLLAGRGYRILISGSSQERDLCETIAEGITGTVILCDSLADTISFLPHCSAVVGNDSGVVHLAESFQVRTVSLYCATNPLFSCGLSENSIYLADRHSCSPSEIEQYCHCSGCKKTERMNISVEEVLRLVI